MAIMSDVCSVLIASATIEKARAGVGIAVTARPGTSARSRTTHVLPIQVAGTGVRVVSAGIAIAVAGG